MQQARFKFVASWRCNKFESETRAFHELSGFWKSYYVTMQFFCKNTSPLAQDCWNVRWKQLIYRMISQGLRFPEVLWTIPWDEALLLLLTMLLQKERCPKTRTNFLDLFFLFVSLLKFPAWQIPQSQVMCLTVHATFFQYNVRLQNLSAKPDAKNWDEGSARSWDICGNAWT